VFFGGLRGRTAKMRMPPAVRNLRKNQAAFRSFSMV
jgi:hypothetical protein